MIQESDDVFNGPDVRGDPRFHRGRDAQRLMNANEVVVHVEQRDRVSMILDLLTERICQPREPADVHPHREVLPFDVTRGNVHRIWIASHGLDRATEAHGRAVPLLRLRVRPVGLLEHCVIDLASKGILDGREIHLVTVRGQLNPVRDPETKTRPSQKQARQRGSPVSVSAAGMIRKRRTSTARQPSRGRT